MRLKGSIKSLKSTEDRMGDIINTVMLEVVGDVKALHDYQQKPLDITLEIENIA